MKDGGVKKVLLFVLVLILLGGIYYFQAREAVKKEKQKMKESKVFDLNKGDIIKIDLKNSKGEVVFGKKDNNLWYITHPLQELADNNVLNQILSGFACVNKKDTIGENPGLDKFDLDKNYIDLMFYLKDGKKEGIHIGDTTPSGDSNYAVKDGSKEIILICSSYINLISKTPSEYENKALWEDMQNVVRDNLVKVVIKKGDSSFSITKDKAGKWASFGKSSAAKDECHGFVNILATYEATRFIKALPLTMSRMGVLNPKYKIYLYCRNLKKPLELDIGNYDKTKGLVWVKASNSREIAGVWKDLLNNLERLYKLNN